MRRTSIVTLSLALAAILAAGPVLAQPENIILDNGQDYGGGKERGPVAFTHMDHIGAGLECSACHHVFVKGRNVVDESTLTDGNADVRCAHCHGKPGSKASPEADVARRGLREAFHGQCLGCHTKMIKEKPGAKSGPLACGSCHTKQAQ